VVALVRNGATAVDARCVVIVSCPSCKTRYRWHAEPGGRGVCDRCEAEVPLVASEPVFVVRARAEAVAVRVAAGAPAAVSRAPVGRAPAPVRAQAPDPPEEQSLSLAPSAVEFAWPPAAEPAPKAGRAAAAPSRPAQRGRGRSGSVLRRLAQLGVVVLLAGGGVVAGHYAMMKGVVGPLQVHAALDPLDPLLVGGLVGMLISWPLIRWMAPRR